MGSDPLCYHCKMVVRKIPEGRERDFDILIKPQDMAYHSGQHYIPYSSLVHFQLLRKYDR
ncbi:conserved hypothetical protein [Ricinus communis]|uniref:Uncharacterized protein n=1 Tax=Ricinus communis TaxID=3988 RepID=B9RG79_RICCO|nr:conserved hypothetical protein [Ricinus communis]